MYEDRFGFIWLGTAEGLYRFDGINFTLYTSKDVNRGLGREVISCFFEDNRQNFWVGSKSGLYRFDPAKKDFDKFSFGDDMYPGYIYQENDSTFLVLCVGGIFRFKPGSGRWEIYDAGLNEYQVYDMVIGKHNHLWIGTSAFVRKYDLLSKKYYDFTLPVPSYAKPGEKISVANMFMDSRDRLWINTWYKGVVELDTRTGEMTLFDTISTSNKGKLLNIFVQSFSEDEYGNVWMANADEGISIYHSDTGTFSYILEGAESTYGLKGRDFVLFTDMGKNMWVKSDLALHYMSRGSPKPSMKSDPDVHIPYAVCMKFLRPDYLLLGTYNGMYAVNIESRKVTLMNELIQLPSTFNAEFQAVMDVLSNGQNLWVSSPQGLRKLSWRDKVGSDPEFTFEMLFPSIPSFLPTKLFQLNDSMILVRGRINTNTFATFNIESAQYAYYTLPDSMLINYAIPHNTDTVLLAIRNKGLAYFSLSDKGIKHIPWFFHDGTASLVKPVFYRIVPLKDGKYALCTENYGLVFFDPVTQGLRQVDVASVANTNRVHKVDEDHQQNLWIQTVNQLLFYNRTSGAISKISLANLFRTDDLNLLMRDGNLFYCLFNGGLYEIDPDRLFFKTTKPKLYLESIKARDYELRWNQREPIKLGYSNNFLTYDFVGLDYDNPREISYWYSIPELNKDWIFLGNRTSVSFGRLSPGKYHFTVKAVNDAGIWSDEIHAPGVFIRPPFWRSWWFVAAMVFVLASVVAYVQRLRRVKREAEVTLRNQIARDLHDDIGSTLSGIKIFSVIASGMAEQNKELTSLLLQIRDKSDVIMQAISDIVWSINPAHDSVHDMMIRLKQYMAEILESQDIEVHFAAPADLKNLKIDLTYRKELYLTLKEIINNAAKYSSCRNFYLILHKQKESITFIVRDDGIGMDEATIQAGNGLHNIETRINNIGASFLRVSAPGKGVKYEIQLQLH